MAPSVITEEQIREIVSRVVEEEIASLRQEFMERELGRPGPEWGEIRQAWRAIDALAEAQRRTEERVEQLAEAQRRTEERLQRLEETVQALTEAMNRMSRQLGQLANLVGMDIEADAEEVLRAMVEEKGLRMLQDPIAIAVDGEVDLAVPVETPAGERIWILVKVKGRLRRAELGDGLCQLRQPAYQERLRQAGVEKPYLPYAFGMRIYLGVEEMAREAGVGILTFRGERVAPRLWE